MIEILGILCVRLSVIIFLSKNLLLHWRWWFEIDVGLMGCLLWYLSQICSNFLSDVYFIFLVKQFQNHFCIERQ